MEELSETAQKSNKTEDIEEFRNKLMDLKEMLYDNTDKLTDKQSKFKPEIDETEIYPMVDSLFSDIPTEYVNISPGKTQVK